MARAVGTWIALELRGHVALHPIDCNGLCTCEVHEEKWGGGWGDENNSSKPNSYVHHARAKIKGKSLLYPDKDKLSTEYENDTINNPYVWASFEFFSTLLC